MRILTTNPNLVLFSAAVLAASTAVATAQTSFVLNPTMDAFVTTGPTGNLINNNYGGAGSVAVSAPGLEMGELQTVMQFSLAGAVNAFDTTYGAGNWTVESVSLRLTAGNANNAIFNSPGAGMFRVSWMQNDSWQEGTGTPAAPGTSGITFASLQSTFVGPGDQSLGIFSFNGSSSGNFTYSLDLSQGLISDINSGGNASFQLYATDSTMSGVFSSRNFGTATSRPVLTIVAVPEPGTMALFALGGILALFHVLRTGRAKG